MRRSIEANLPTPLRRPPSVPSVIPHRAGTLNKNGAIALTVETYDMTPDRLRSAAYLRGLADADYREIAKHDLGRGRVMLSAGSGNPGGERFLAIMIERGWARRMPD
jgi:hypothetical protein